MSRYRGRGQLAMTAPREPAVQEIEEQAEEIPALHSNGIYDAARLRERVAVVIRNLRAFAGAECAGPDDLLRRDDLLQRAVTPALTAYDGELAMMWQQYTDAGRKVFDLQEQLNFERFAEIRPGR